ncbi:hypothetical protein JCM10213_006872, partial [Rhodosporidiobolus nylandii]
AVWEVLDKRGQDKPEESGYYKAVKACSGTNFFGMGRLGESTTSANGHSVPAGKSIDEIWLAGQDCSGADFRFERDPETGVKMVTLHLPYTKRTRNKGEDIYVPEQKTVDEKYCPVQAVVEHMEANRPGKEDPSFSYIDRNGRRKWLTSGAVVNTFNEVLQELGKERIWGHSFRIGGGNFYTV